MKKYYFCLVLVVAFVGGLFVGKIIYHQPSKYLSVGVIEESFGPGAVYYDEKMVLTNLNSEDEYELDLVERFIYTAQPIGEIEAPREHPDYTINIGTYNSGTIYIRDEIWFTDEGAIFGKREYESQIIKEAYQLPKEQALFIKEIIDKLESRK